LVKNNNRMDRWHFMGVVPVNLIFVSPHFSWGFAGVLSSDVGADGCRCNSRGRKRWKRPNKRKSFPPFAWRFSSPQCRDTENTHTRHTAYISFVVSWLSLDDFVRSLYIASLHVVCYYCVDNFNLSAVSHFIFFFF
jgi:hypothetical protein